MTHQVTNQVPAFEGRNLFETDPFLVRTIRQLGAEDFERVLLGFGAECGSVTRFEDGRLANEHQPILHAFDRVGNRINEVQYHPSYHALMSFSMQHGLHTGSWQDERPGSLIARCAKNYMMTQVEAGHGCPITMTFAAVPALKTDAALADFWIPKLLSTRYDHRNIPAAEKTACTVGMAMTEKQGGSDVRANQTQAILQDDGTYRLVGHKWFCSAPMSDLFLTLAKSEGQITCFIVPRWDHENRPNRMQLQRLKDKVGNRSNASSEIEYDHAFAQRLGAVGRGVATIIEMVTHTRLDCIVASAANMRLATAHAIHHAQHRKAFGTKLYDQPVMRTVLADLALETMAATALAFNVAQFYELGRTDERKAALARLWTAIGKYWVCKRSPFVVTEAMESHGGNGYVKPHLMSRLYAEAPLNSIWEGSGNVICLDVLRALGKMPNLGNLFLKDVATRTVGVPGATECVDRLKKRLHSEGAVTEARALVEDMALLLQAACLNQMADSGVAEAFGQARLVDRGFQMGALTSHVAVDHLLEQVSK